MVYKKINLAITTSDGQVVTITVSPTKKISEVKAMVSQKTGITVDKFKLVDGTGLDLDETFTLVQSGVK
jgi:hypothetical protein